LFFDQYSELTGMEIFGMASGIMPKTMLIDTAAV